LMTTLTFGDLKTKSKAWANWSPLKPLETTGKVKALELSFKWKGEAPSRSLQGMLKLVLDRKGVSVADYMLPEFSPNEWAQKSYKLDSTLQVVSLQRPGDTYELVYRAGPAPSCELQVNDAKVEIIYEPSTVDKLQKDGKSKSAEGDGNPKPKELVIPLELKQDITVDVKRINGVSLSLQISPKDTIKLVKQKVEVKDSKLKATQTILILGRKKLEDSSTVDKAGIKEGDILRIIVGIKPIKFECTSEQHWIGKYHDPVIKWMLSDVKLSGPRTSITATVDWKDQGWGNRKGQLFLKLMRPQVGEVDR